MKEVVRLFLALAVAGVVVALGWPWIKDGVYVAHLLAQERPSALPVPVSGVPARAVRDTWGAARDGNRLHQGVDIFARRGTPVTSTTRGLVWKIGENALGGKVVWVLGPGGDLHYYAHLDRVADIEWRQRLEPGAVIGYVGNSGNARRTPSHLHYGIYRRSTGAVNPYPLLMDPGDERQARRRAVDPG